MLRLTNSLTKQKETFKPIQPNKIGIYACGVTVYDECHIGHARTNLAFDVIVRYLRFSGYEVKYVRNITDIDDKIIKRAAERNIDPSQLVEQYIQIMHEQFEQLGVLKPDCEPRATQTIDDMIAMITQLINKDFAYVTASGDVCYRVTRFKDYGKLSGQNIEQLHSGLRVEVNDEKENPLDFVLWKAAKPGEPSWTSPWGEGRPGWHIECSCMSKAILGDTFDIHGGGSDLRFPHHENEIAQSEAANGKHFANYWLHSGMVRINEEKMSKSLGNFFTITEVLKQYPAEVIRYFLISVHYRHEVNYSQENLDAAQQALMRLYTALRGVKLDDTCRGGGSPAIAKFISAMDDDFNTPEAFAVLFELAREINIHKQSGDTDKAQQIAGELKYLGNVLGLLQQNPESFLRGSESELDVAKIETLITQRNEARQAKDWAKADQARDALTAMGIALEDSANGTIWRKG